MCRKDRPPRSAVGPPPSEISQYVPSRTRAPGHLLPTFRSFFSASQLLGTNEMKPRAGVHRLGSGYVRRGHGVHQVRPTELDQIFLICLDQTPLELLERDPHVTATSQRVPNVRDEYRAVP